jgi:HAE1 family hydrophobic/amphiphilic exporter-1
LQEIQAGQKAPMILGLAVLFAYLFLVAQYNSWSIPFAVTLAVPIAALGAIAGLMLAGIANDIFAQIGMVLLIGLAAKNAILIVEFARVKRAEGAAIVDAATTAARLRFRAIMMTAFSFILGVLPLLLASGAGAASRRSIGTTVFAGMLAATIVGTLLVPAFYVAIQRLAERRGRPAARPAAGSAVPPPPAG